MFIFQYHNFIKEKEDQLYELLKCSPPFIGKQKLANNHSQ